MLLYLFLLLALSGCIVKFSVDDKRVWLNYEKGEILIFENQFGARDTITIVKNKTRHLGWSLPGMDTPGTGKYDPIEGTIWVCVKDRINPLTGECKSVFVNLYKAAGNGPTKVKVSFDELSQTCLTDTLNPIDLFFDPQLSKTYKNLYIIYNVKESSSQKRPLDLNRFFWSLDDGLIRYDKFNGEIWERINI
ncbi:MAG: hypothetical protein GXO89_10940 [Chlorobi bacterium]|nr:hypothetical protein [Chlorobiota bacterium]